MDDTAIRELVTRLARPRRDGGHVVERAAILAAGADSAAVEAWILHHAGTPEQLAPTTAITGLHGGRLHEATRGDRSPRRFLLPAATLQARPPAPDKEPGNAPQDPDDLIDAQRQATSERG